MEKDKRGASYTSPKPNIPAGNSFKRNRGMQPVVKPKNFKETLIRLWEYFGKERKLLIVIFTLVIISSAFGLLVPYLIGKAVDALNLGKLYVDFKTLKIIAIVLISTYIMDSLITLLQGFIMAGISQRIVFGLREALFEKLQSLPLMFFDTHTHGEIMSRLSNDIENVSTTISQSTIQLMSSFINIIGAFTMMIILSPLLTVASMVTLPLVLFMTNSIAKRTKVLFKEQQVVLGKLNGHIEESISGIHVVKAFNREDKIIEEFDDLNSNLCEVGIKAQVWSGYIMPLMNVINNIGFAAVAAIGGVLAVKDLITVGIIASFISYSRQFARPLNDLASIFNTFQSAVAGAERVFETLDEKEEPRDIKNAQVLSNVRGDVEFQNVTFGYNEDSYVLKDISFNVKRGENIALVGPTGAGKTTIVNLLTGFYNVSKGDILIDGKSIKKYTKDSLRKAFGIVLQDSYLFSDTIKENIRYGNLNATDEEIESAAKLANADAFISKLPKGYNTIISEGGVSLSQGEKQLVSIARAILSNPSILVLDEATSSVDTRTELKIQEALLGVMKGRTSFIIAHRLSTIKDADKIMVIDNGSIMEMGTHEELIKRKEYYYKLYDSQFN
ncbi:ABC transporter ATP-binding protein [Clostridium algidicarnis]|uniref:ATP-binding cassette subfamily B protein n=2 Tax=Clostridium algidicarnis TaxID=37659 RepID=A0A2S6FW67_9CLOT|nr:ABC transporter ATP-binding protein [Clostridium algidicarnis]MBU3194284.1 ABC transporter ATP-binding protein/permease [Clostridium algidicarnis]MBU3220215.1 ABC transporter ATP-binding protein/permease [Clostridium algidicarnis]PPK47784.1 ATP-binding cassette subfamily B protein [Clostridium algidicarnis DSM 15099]